MVYKEEFKTIFMLVYAKSNFQAFPRGLNTKNGDISNFYERLAYDFMIYKEDFKTIFMLVQVI